MALALAVSLTGCFAAFNDYESGSSQYYDLYNYGDDQDSSITNTIKPASHRDEDTGNGASDADKKAEQEDFAAFVEESYKASIESSYLATHIYYINPEAAGIDTSNTEVSFGTAPTEAEMKESREYYKELANIFATFNRSLLTPEQQIEYDAMKWELAVVTRMSDEKFDYYEQLFAAPNSLDANIVSYLSSWDIRHETDAKNMATLINSIPAYVDSAIVYAKEQQSRKLLMTDFDAVIKGCQDVLDNGMESSVLRKLLEKVDKLELDQAAKDKYKEDITTAFRDSYLPSFQKIIDAMEEMRGGYNNTEGYYFFPYGREYYEVLLMYASGTLDSAERIYSYLENKSDSLLSSLFNIYAKYPDDVDAYYDDNAPKSGFKTYQEILDTNKTALLADHPEVKNLDYHIEDADPEEKLDEKNIAAYFLIPPLDGDRVQQMRVEPTGRDIESLDTYITVSHEGFPGHMYHYAYLYSNIDSDYIKTLGVDAVIEGYAVYAELEALNYLNDVGTGFKELIKVSTALSYADYTLADIGVNYYGWSQSEMQEFFTDIGYSIDDESAKEIFDYLRCTPAAYAPYGYGYLRIADIRAGAESRLGSKFDLLDFNTAFLKAGAVPFAILEEQISQYVNEKK